MIARPLLFSIVFVGLDLICFGVIYALIVLFTKHYGLVDALSHGGVGVMARLIYFQAIAQFLLLALVRYYNLHQNVLVVLVAGVGAFALTSVYFLKNYSTFLKYFTVDIELKLVGPGLVLIASVLLTWLILFKFSRLHQSL